MPGGAQLRQVMVVLAATCCADVEAALLLGLVPQHA